MEYCAERVCLSVCPLARLRNHNPNFVKFSLCMSPYVLVARSSSDGVAIRYVLPVLWMTLFQPIICQTKATQVIDLIKVTYDRLTIIV